jgi:hypothetical protein
MVGGEAEAVGEPADRGGGVNPFSGEERVEFGDHAQPGSGEEPFAELQQLGGEHRAGRGMVALAATAAWSDASSDSGMAMRVVPLECGQRVKNSPTTFVPSPS